MKRAKYLLTLLLIALPLTAMGQKPKTTTDFAAETLPTDLLEYLNKASSEKSVQKENTKVVDAFGAAYSAMDATMQQRVTDLYIYAVGVKIKALPELVDFTRVLTAYATAPGGSANLEGWVASVETYRKKNSKVKYVNDFVSWSELLLSDRVLYRSSTSEWTFNATTPFRLAVENGAIVVRVDAAADLSYASSKDWNTLHGTRGWFDYREGVWHGQGGRLDWARTGLGAEACYADLRDYEAEVKFPKFKADSVTFVNTHYFSAPIQGRVEEAMQGTMEPDKYTYPRFRSYQRDFVIRNIMPDVDYSGSFMMNGSKFITASSKHPASLIFNRDGRPRLSVTSLKFTITPERLLAENAQVALYLGAEDSITNTGITVRYIPGERRVTLVNDQQRKFYSPYIDSYHQLDIYSESIVWLVDQDRLEFSNLTSAGAVSTNTFESSNCYTYRKYRDIQGIDEISPVKRVYEYAESNSWNFGIKGFSNYIGLDMSQTLLMIHTLCRHGLVTYNEITNRVLVKEKLEDYVKAASRAKGFDYDALTFESTTRGVNARMSLTDNDLVVRGVEQFVVSDSHQVVVRPDSASGYVVHVGRNRALHFSGRVEVGKFILQVTDCDFDYERYAFEMPQIDKLEFYVPDFTNPDYEQLVRTPLAHLVGSLQVDKPDNHSGLVKNKEYPIFNSRENCYVYYNRKAIQEGQYRRETFYYTIEPFTLPQLADFKVDSLQFGGVLTSAGIFPDIREPLKVQRDYYLGFVTQTPKGGLPAYGGKGVYHNELHLDAGGLHGPGHVDYLTSHSTSSNFLFLPDSCVALTDTVVVREEQGYPAMRAGLTSLHWLPYNDSLSVATLAKGRPLSLYRSEATLRGHMAIMPQGAMAAGTATVREATLASRRFDLMAREMEAQVSTFTLQSRTFASTAFEARDVRSQVDYDEHRATLTMPDGPRRTELELMQYEAWADRFVWQMDDHVLDIANSQRTTSEGLDAMDIRLRLAKIGDLPGARFVSTDPRRQGLTYNSILSTYRYERADLSSEGVYLIGVADAAIAPAGDSVHITKGGEMRVLTGATLLCDREHAWHTITDAYLLINGSSSYTGKGYVIYPESQPNIDNPQRIYLSDIQVKDGMTIGSGTINEETAFQLSSAFGFAGKVRLEGNRQMLYFDGGVRLLHHCVPQEQMGLLAYADYTDPDSIHVTVPELPTDWRGKRISAAILIDKTTLEPRPAFLTNERAADNELLSAYGVLTFHNESQEYMIGSEDKVVDPEAVIEPYLSLSTATCRVAGEGLMDFTLKRTQAEFYCYGVADIGIRDNNTDQINTVFGINFPLASDVIAAMTAAIKDDLRLNPTAPQSNGVMRHALMYHLGAERGAKVYTSYSNEGKLTTIPEPMRSMLLFDQVRWHYLQGFGYYCDGKVGLVAADGRPIGLDLRLKAQISKRGNAQTMTFYVEAARDHWYFFRYDLMNQELTIHSSVGTFEDAVRALPAEKRRVERDGLGTFRYLIGQNRNDVTSWLTNFSKMVYSGDDDE
ncbi:MAG: hypothetical protein K6E96_08380 [Bacteroidales bacterium]|nr:hypothetical protein [Bacteroidales bacterium]